ncbi:GNAT family N-acetyltransferase [Paenibacillus sp. FSL R5-0490]|uniref:GNAT family N-acetyltransferase n=1 Tax=Paenibacillus sp. FSL R5-0490 TaxID=1920424 RepID=UPI00096D443E|nr:GNAT family N-acetyltransferase [Paenibacillus sp. FSL R5-0490]OMF55019.1 GNAT family N-acetyltransferase [Paenibacillus sp. FSL R5-0490]
MSVSKLTENEYIEAMKLSMYAFQYNVPEADIPARMERLKNHAIFGIWEGESLAAKLHIIPLKVHINGFEWDMGGVAGVATYPEFRRRGHVSSLIKHALAEMNNKDQLFSFLHPFDISFYRKYGWEIFTEYKKTHIKKIDLKMTGKSSGTIKRFTKNQHTLTIEKIYKEYMQRYSGGLVRDTYWWENFVYSDYQIAVYFNESGEGQGYILFKVKDNRMDIEEFAALNQEARLNLWNFICQHDSMVEEVKIITSVHDPFPYYLNQPNLKMEVFPYFMGRIVNAEKCLGQYSFNEYSENVFLHIEDHHAPWNNGSYLIADEGVRVFKEKAGSQCTNPPARGLHMSINALSAIIIGYKRPMELYDLGEIKGPRNDAEILEGKIPVQKSFFYDFF